MTRLRTIFVIPVVAVAIAFGTIFVPCFLLFSYTPELVFRSQQ
jgi:hypothetical protein